MRALFIGEESKMGLISDGQNHLTMKQHSR